MSNEKITHIGSGNRAATATAATEKRVIGKK